MDPKYDLSVDKEFLEQNLKTFEIPNQLEKIQLYIQHSKI